MTTHLSSRHPSVAGQWLRLLAGLLGVVALLAGGCGAPSGGPSPAASVESGPSNSPISNTLPSALKLYVSQPGIYRLTPEVLGLPKPVDWQRIRLRYRDRELPPFVPPGGDALYFYAPPPAPSRYTREDTVWVEFGVEPSSDMRAVAAPPEGDREITTSLAHVVAEENRLYQPLAGGTSPWFWAQLAAPATWETEITLDHVIPGEGVLSVTLWAKTKAPINPDHHWRLFVNGQPVGDVARDGDGEHVVEVPLPAGLLREGSNTVRLEAPGDLGAVDISFLDRVAITYPRELVVNGGRLRFEAERTGPHRVRGLKGPAQVFDVTDPLAPQRLTGVRQEGDEVVFTGQEGRWYEVVTESGALRPDRVEAPVLSPDLRALTGGEYVAIGPADLLEPLDPLLRWRSSQGLRVQVVPVEAVFDQFGYGLPEPAAIRAFLKHAAQTWDPPPRYVLLVGDTTFDFQGWTVAREVNRLPTFMAFTVFGGETASDALLAQLNDDPWPDVALGRIPASTPEQVQRVVAKTLAYEQQAASLPWRERILAVADGAEASFAADARRFLGQLGTFQTALLSPPAGAPDGAKQVEQALNEGAFLVAYFGHGSITLWGKDRLFAADQVGALNNAERLPIVVQMTCLTGLFTHPNVTSLTEALLWAEGGAVAALAPTSLTLPTDQSFLADALASALTASPERLGDLFLQAQRQVPVESQGARDVLYTFLLFGDPALRLTPSD